MDIVGSWNLVDYVFEDSEGARVYPFGKKPTGFGMFDAQGNMSAQIMYDTPLQMDIPPTEAQAARAYYSYVAYFGKYRLDQEKKILITRVSAALNRGWVAGDQVRYFSFENDRLVLKMPPFKLGDHEFTGTLYWERA